MTHSHERGAHGYRRHEFRSSFSGFVDTSERCDGEVSAVLKRGPWHGFLIRANCSTVENPAKGNMIADIATKKGERSMKYPLTLMFLAVCLTGCASSSEAVGGGYYLKTTRYFSWEPPGVSESLYFRGPHESRRVCENFTGRFLVHESTVLFVAANRSGEDELLAARDGGTSLEVGKPILAFEAGRQSADAASFVEQHLLDTGYLKELADGFELEYWHRHGVNHPPEHFSLTWDEFSAIMHRAETERAKRASP